MYFALRFLCSDQKNEVENTLPSRDVAGRFFLHGYNFSCREGNVFPSLVYFYLTRSLYIDVSVFRTIFLYGSYIAEWPFLSSHLVLCFKFNSIHHITPRNFLITIFLTNNYSVTGEVRRYAI